MAKVFATNITKDEYKHMLDYGFMRLFVIAH